MTFELSLNTAIRDIYAATNIAGPVHHHCSPAYVGRKCDEYQIMSDVATTRWQALCSGAQLGAAKRMQETLAYAHLPFMAMDTLVGNGADRPFATLIPTRTEQLRQGIGLVGYGLIINDAFNVATLPLIAAPMAQAAVVATIIAAAAGLACWASGAPGEVSLDHAAEIMFLPLARGPIQALSLASGLIKAACLALAALVGAVIGAVQGLMRTLPVYTPDARNLPCVNDETVASLEPLRDVPDAYFFRTTTGYGFDVRELAKHNENRRVWLNPYTSMALSEEDVSRLSLHPAAEARALVRNRFSTRAAAIRLPEDTVHQLATLCGALNHSAPEEHKEAVLGAFVEHLEGLSAEERADVDAVMVSSSGETLRGALLNLNPGMAGAGGCANATTAYLVDRLNYIRSVRRRAQAQTEAPLNMQTHSMV